MRLKLVNSFSTVCGLAGFERKCGSDDLTIYQPVLRHRGPDSTGYFQDEHYSFIHWRLSIIDLSDKANQPYFFDNLMLLYNGEIYNYREIAEELKTKGYVFDTTSDTEVLIKAFHCWGVEAVRRFTGMFAFVIYHIQTHEFWLFRDRVGVKPLYYSLHQGFSFASEVKFFHALQKSLTIDPIALHQYFRFGFVPGNRTIFNEIKKVGPGQYLHYRNHTPVLRYWWNLPEQNNNLPSIEKPEEELEQLLINAFKYRMVSDVPVGVFLSGGVDSSLLATLLQHHSGKKIHTFSIGFDDDRFDETKYARAVADRLQTTHVEMRARVEDAEELFRQFYDVYDEPFADTSGIPVALISRLSKSHGVKVVLSADGGDELFGGYPHYQRINKWLNWYYRVPLLLRRMTGSALKKTIPHAIRHTLKVGNLSHRLNRAEELLLATDLVRFYEASISNQTDAAIQEITGFPVTATPLLQGVNNHPQEVMMKWDFHYYLPDDLLMKVDRATMYHSIEGREPMLDHHVVEFSARLPLRQKIVPGKPAKIILRNILAKYHPRELFDRPKQGFSIPIFSWFSKSLDHLFDQYLHDQALRHNGLLNARAVSDELVKYRYFKQKGKDYNMEKIWRILSFMMWKEKWMK